MSVTTFKFRSVHFSFEISIVMRIFQMEIRVEKKNILKGLHLSGVQKMYPPEKVFIGIIISLSRHSVWHKVVLIASWRLTTDFS